MSFIDHSEDAAAEAILKGMGVEEGPLRKAPDEDEEIEDGHEEEQDDEELADSDTEEGGTSDDEESEDESEEEPSVKKPKKVVIDPDAEAYVKIRSGDKDIEVKVGDLTKLYGQNDDLVFQSAEVKELKRTTDAQAQKYAAGLEAMLQRATDRAKPYANLNFLLLAKDPNVSPEELTALSAEAQKAFDDVNYLQQSLDGVVQEAQKTRHVELVKQGAQAWKILSDPEKGIKGWDNKTYKDVSAFAVSSGIDKRVMDDLVDPAAIKLLHMAMLYSKGQAASVTTQKVDKTPKRILKNAPESTTQRANKPQSHKAAFKQLQKTGSLDDAASAFLARMAVED